MKTIRAFLAKASYTNNVVGQISEFFELSPFALTFSKRKGEYQYINFPGDILHTFVTKDGDADYTLGVTELDEVSSVVASAVDYMTSHLFPFDLTDLFNTVQADMAGRISQLQFGAIKVGLEHTLPEWIEWRSVTHVDLVVRVWLSNEAFENQYTEYEIVTVPPIDNLDRFFGHYGALASELGALTITDTIGRIQDFKDGFPESYTRVYAFDYINPQNSAQSLKVNWGVLVYGKNGDNIDAIKDAIVNYVLTNSTHTLNEWRAIFPELFKRTEFLFYPRWDKIAIPNLTDLAALYSSVSEPADSYNFALQKWTRVDSEWIRTNLSVFPFDYKAIHSLVLNGTTNVAGKERITELFKDYIPVSTSSVDFNRMSLSTREWLLLMVELIKVAETATEYSSIQNPIRRVNRDGILYVTRLINSVNYLVAVRQQSTNPTPSTPTIPASIEKPFIDTPLEGAVDVPVDSVITSSTFSFVGSGEIHQSTDWEVSTDNAFNNVVLTRYDDTTALTSLEITGLQNETMYYVRNRYRSLNGLVSPWSETRSFVIIASANNQQQVIMNPVANPYVEFGLGVFYDQAGTHLYITSPSFTNTDTGSVDGVIYIYTRNSQGVWVLSSQLASPEQRPNEYFGKMAKLCANDTMLIVSAPEAMGNQGTEEKGRVYIFSWTNNTWVHQQTLSPPFSENTAYQGFGVFDVSNDGSLLVVSSSEKSTPDVPGQGAWYTYVRDAGLYHLDTAYLTEEPVVGLYTMTGAALSLSGAGDYLAVLTPNGQASENGYIECYARLTGPFIRQAVIIPPGPSEQTLLVKPWASTARTRFNKLTLNTDASFMVVSTEELDEVYVYTRTGTDWTLLQRLAFSETDLTGSPHETRLYITPDSSSIYVGMVGGSDSGLVYQFQKVDGLWLNVKTRSSPVSSYGNYFGRRGIAQNPANLELAIAEGGYGAGIGAVSIHS